jgi:hypothetical protein
LDDPTATISSTVTIASTRGEFKAGAVAVYLDVLHIARGHLQVVLTSPQGTSSVLHPGRRPESTQLDDGERWKLLTVRNWDESPIGEWTLSIVDLKEGDTDACVSKAFTWTFGDTEFTCSQLESFGYCADGVLDPFFYLYQEEFDEFSVFVDNGLTAAEACCACGGAGLDGDEIVDQLRQWRLIVYG